MTAARLAAPVLLLAAAAAVPWIGGLALAAALAAGLAAHAALGRRFRALLRLACPILLFAPALVALQWVNGAVDLRLPLRTIAVFVLTTAAFRILPWPRLIAEIPAGSRWYLAAMFLLFVRHFTGILLEEARRTLQARSLCISRSRGPGSFTSLAWAVAALFRRALERAERFYAVQSMGGFPE